MSSVLDALRATHRNVGTLRDAMRVRNARVLMSLLGPAIRGYVLRRGKNASVAPVPADYIAHFNWEYEADNPPLAKLYAQAKTDQWNAATDLDWSIDVDPYNPEVDLIHEHLLPLPSLRVYRQLDDAGKRGQRMALMSWLLSQFLHGEQGALFAACQLTEATQWMDGKLYGSTQVVDEGRHVEVFQRYLNDKLGKRYDINDNLYVIIDALMTDSRWDVKFLGMQIMVEGLALAAFGVLRHITDEPLLKELLRRVITDEARHVHFGVVALEQYYRHELSPRELREREDWAFEMCLLMRNRFLAHELYDELFAHSLSRKQWDQIVTDSPFMQFYRQVMFKRIIPNLKRINLLSDRIRPYYEDIGLLQYEHGAASPELTADDMLGAPA